MAQERFAWATLDDKRQIEAIPAEQRWPGGTVYQMLAGTAARHPSRPAVSFQLKGGPADPAETLDWTALKAQVTQAANLFRSIGVGDGDAVAYVLPNATETVLALLGGMTAGVVSPVNPLLETAQIAAILRETGAKVVVTLAPFPKTDIAQKVHAAVAEAPGVETVLEVDLKRYLRPPLSWLVPLLRPKVERRHRARVLDFRAELARARADALDFAEDRDPDRIAAMFHTGGTTGHPKIARHCQRGMVYNGHVGALCLIGAEDVLICPLPLFHVLAAYPVTMTALASGAHLVLPTPAGYRGEGVMDNFWKLVERWGVSFMVMVPTAASALMQRPVNADVSSLKYALCGSAPLPVELFRRFEEATGLRILEGYGMTEATCLVSINPPDGERKIGSVGLPIPYTAAKILHCAADGTVLRDCATDEVGEICLRSPGVFPGYKDPARNAGLFAQPGDWLRTGDLGRIDADGYIWITGRAKDLIIRGGHNIDPALIEEALAGHPAVAFVGAIGQPDAHSGEVPCAYVELAAGAQVTQQDLLDFAAGRIAEKAAVPKTIEILDELPKTAVGKIFKPDLRKRATARIYTRALLDAGIRADVTVVEDPKLGLTAEIAVEGPEADEHAIEAVLGVFARPWRLRR
ncbi:acyl-CoA synthetase [Limibaculum sp. FT325]|uniref:acyl-CoA synthetase n=1 Tax=Thermohalobaculum sediminis TaxID=2939436 RepID=UPI0020BD930A|nr:acyl-CoA synthetase [Limibaculum sediminis]MCL5778002.1 acyl-CoA synthetase [Limibaculum sediminis]